MKHKILLLFSILLIASILRLYKLGDVPPSPDWDEAALGYNAYSILKTGKDEYGTLLPLAIRSFDDYKPPLYVYLTVPSVALFGLSTWSTRLPSVIMGVLAVIGVYFLVKRLFDPEYGDKLALLSTLLLSISPWHIQFSRIAFEANTGITINIWAVTLFLTGLKKKKFLPISAFLFALGFYAYHSERVFLPLLAITLLVIYRKELFRPDYRKYLLSACVVGIATLLPLIPLLLSPAALLRVRGTSSFTDQTQLLSRSITKLERDQMRNDKFGELLDNRRFVWAKTVISGYLSHYSFRWLFFTGDNPRHHAPDMGLLYVWELPFLLYGFYSLIAISNKSTRNLLVTWLLIAPVAAAPTTGLPHAIRSLVFLPAFQIVTALGLLQITRVFSQKKKILFIVSSLYFIFILVNIVYYVDMYFVHQNSEVSKDWQYGYKEAVTTTERLKSQYKKIVVSTSLEQSYMFYLFYTAYDPKAYQLSGGTRSGSFEESSNAFDIYEFRSIEWSKEIRDGSILYVGAPWDMPHGNIANIKFLDGTPAIEIADQPNGAL